MILISQLCYGDGIIANLTITVSIITREASDTCGQRYSLMAKRGASDDDGKVMIANVADGLRGSHGILLGETFPQTMPSISLANPPMKFVDPVAYGEVGCIIGDLHGQALQRLLARPKHSAGSSTQQPLSGAGLVRCTA